MAIRDIFRSVLEALWFSDFAFSWEFEILIFYLEAVSHTIVLTSPYSLLKSDYNSSFSKAFL